jgi:hypothetical protein
MVSLNASIHNHLRTKSCELDTAAHRNELARNGDSSRKQRNDGEGSCQNVRSAYLDEGVGEERNRKEKEKEWKFVFPCEIKKYSIRMKKEAIPRLVVSHLTKNKMRTETENYMQGSAKMDNYRNKSVTKSFISKSLMFDRYFSPIKHRSVKYSLRMSKILNEQKILDDE